MKRNVLDILVKIYESLPKDRDFTLNEIAIKNKITWRVINKHIHALQALGLVRYITPSIDEKWKRIKWRVV